MNTTIVNTCDKIYSLLNEIEGKPTTPPTLYICLEGVIDSDYQFISVLILFLLPSRKVFLVDLLELQGAAFNIAISDSKSLRSILESPNIPKIFFSVRDDARALYAHFKVSLKAVHDLQLLEAASRPEARYLSKLEDCMLKHTLLNNDDLLYWQRVKISGQVSVSQFSSVSLRFWIVLRHLKLSVM